MTQDERQEATMEAVRKAIEEGNEIRERNGRKEVFICQTGLGSMWLDIETGDWN